MKSHGGTFSIILLPNGREDSFAPFVLEGVEVMSLFRLISELIPDFPYQAIRFKNDGHWNELANMLAAWVLFEALEARMA